LPATASSRPPSSERPTPPVAVRLAGVSVLKIAPAGKPCCYGFGVWRKNEIHPNPVGARLPATASSRPPSPERPTPRPVAVRLAGVSALKIAPAGKPCCYGFGAWRRNEIHPNPVGARLPATASSRPPSPERPTHRPVAVRLAGVSVLKITPAGKPCCYDFGVWRKNEIHPNPVGARLPATASSGPPSPERPTPPRVAVRLAGVSALKIAPAGKPCCYGLRPEAT